VKPRLFRDSNASARPHRSTVDIRLVVVVEIEPGSAHPRSDVFDACLCGDGGEFSSAIIAVQIVSSEVVGHVEVQKTITVVVAPGARKAVPVVVHIQPRRLSPVQKYCIPFVVEQKVRRAIARVKIRSGIVILVQAHVIAVQAEINVQQSVAIVVSDGGMCERPLRRASRTGRHRA